jgi:flavin reductase (DIM6/NTAB) family NADH-FMN oxidoreductase RutF
VISAKERQPVISDLVLPHSAANVAAVDTSVAAHWTCDPATIDRAQQYKLMTGVVLPRPIALVTTCGPQGINAAPFSFFNVLGVEPPMVMFSIGMRGHTEKDTLANLRHCGEMVIHIVDAAHAEQMNGCGGNFPMGVNELALVGLPTVAATKVAPPRIPVCPVQLECVVDRIVPVGAVPYHVVFAEVVLMHFRHGLVDERMRVDIDRLDAIGRMVGPGVYTNTRERFTLPPVE